MPHSLVFQDSSQKFPNGLESPVDAGFKTALPVYGCYSLIIDLNRKKTIQVGKLGEAIFPAGTYVYTGSAMRGLGARLKRHCSRKKKLHWHIDYLLTLQEARVRQIILYPAAPGQECRQNKRIAACAGAVVILHNFGASDCKSGCPSHLLYFAKNCSPKSAEYRDVREPQSKLLRKQVTNLASVSSLGS